MKTTYIRRRGAALIIALTTLLVVMLMTGTIVQALVAETRQTRQSAAELQVHWLADAALARGAAQLRASGAYAGETWQPAIGPDASGIGVAEISVERANGESSQVLLVVQARYPDHASRRITTRRELRINMTAIQETAP